MKMTTEDWANVNDVIEQFAVCLNNPCRCLWEDNYIYTLDYQLAKEDNFEYDPDNFFKEDDVAAGLVRGFIERTKHLVANYDKARHSLEKFSSNYG